MKQQEQKRFIMLIGAGATASLGYPLTSGISIYQEILKLSDETRFIPDLHETKDTGLLKSLIVDIENFLRRSTGQASLEAAIDRAQRYSQIIEEINSDDALAGVFFSKQETRNRAGLLRRRAGALYELLHKVLLNVYGTNHIGTAKDKTEEQELYKNEAEKLVNLINAFRKLNSSETLSIYTTNYDAAWESIEQSTNGSVSFVDRSFSSPTDGVTNTPFNIYRLHGCVRYCRTHDACSYLQDEEIDWEKLEFRVHHDHEHRGASVRKRSLSQLMAIKVGEQEPNLEREPFRTVFEEFEADLKLKGTICVVIGFSFRDVNVAHRVFDALDIGYLSKLVCIDPSISVNDVTERLCIAGGRSPNLDENKLKLLKERIYIEDCEVSNASVQKIIENI